MRFVFFLHMLLGIHICSGIQRTPCFTWNKYVEDTELYKDKVSYQACKVSKGKGFSFSFPKK